MKTKLISNTVQIEAFAKINLSLDILGKRNDGYHEVKMIMQTINLHDILTFSLSPEISLHTTDPYLPTNDHNLVIKAAKLLKNYSKVKLGVKIYLEKRIPVGAGLGGGSADAAATLLALNRLWSLNLSIEELKELAVKIGADIPFCLTGGTALAEGIGEEITVLPSLPQIKLILAKPPFSVSTGLVYQHYQTAPIEVRPITMKIIESIKTGEFWKIPEWWGNVLEEVTLRLYPLIRERMKEVGRFGLPVRMSGSGPTIFLLIPEDFSRLNEVKSILHQDNWWVYEGCFQTKE